MADIRDAILFEDWLLSQPINNCELVANRIALRMLPFWQEFHKQKDIVPTELSNSFPLWWNLFSSWVHFSTLSTNPKIVESKREAEAFYIANSKSQFASFFRAKNQHDRCISLVKFNLKIISNVCNITNSDEPADAMWNEISQDTDAIDAGRSAQFISQKPLWSTVRTPSWVLTKWDEQKAIHLNSK